MVSGIRTAIIDKFMHNGSFGVCVIEGNGVVCVRVKAAKLEKKIVLETIKSQYAHIKDCKSIDNPV